MQTRMNMKSLLCDGVRCADDQVFDVTADIRYYGYRLYAHLHVVPCPHNGWLYIR